MFPKRKLPTLFSQRSDRGTAEGNSSQATGGNPSSGARAAKGSVRKRKKVVLSSDEEDHQPEQSQGSTSGRKLPESFTKRSGAPRNSRKESSVTTAKVAWLSKTKAKALFKLSDTELARVKARTLRNPKNWKRPISMYRTDDLERLAKMRNPQQSLTSLNLGEETADETARSFTLHRLLHERGGCPFPRRHIECVPYSPKPLDVQRLNLATDFVNGNSSYNLVDLVDQIVGLHILEVRRACDIYYGLRSFGIEESVIAVALGMTPDDFNNFESSLDVKLNDDSMAWWQSPITSVLNGLYEHKNDLPLASAINLFVGFQYIQRGTQDKDSVLSDIMAVNFLKGNLVEASSQCGWQTVEAQMIPRILTAAAKIWHSNCITAGKDPNAILEGQPSPCRERLMAFIAVDSVM